jgi:cell division septum initiation protein DivIVA
MFKWLHHLLNPHCPDCREERQQEMICDSCETLKYEIERLRAENERLLTNILQKPEPVIERTVAPEPQALPPRINAWAIRKRLLEEEDKEKAKLLRRAPQVSESTQKLEDELLNAEQVRESEGK